VFSRECLLGFCTALVHRTLSGGTPDTVWWHTGHSGAPDHITLKSILLLLNWVPNLNIYWFVLNLYAHVIHEFLAN
jgi:hypothetical protein